VTLAVEAHAVAPSGLAAWADEWRGLERRSAGTFYLGYDWLSAWAGVYSPRELLAIRVVGPDGVFGLGLIEPGPRRRWRFAGDLVTSERGLLCAAGREDEAWAALGQWLGERRGDWATLEVAGADAGARALCPGALDRQPWPRLRLPRSFDEYLAARPPVVRKAFKQKLRRLEQAGAEVREVEAAGREEGLRAFLRLHLERTASKQESHPQMDVRLLELLAAAGAGPDLELRLFALVAGGRCQGVTVRLDHRGVGYFYNAGFDPAAMRLSPGIVLELASIRDAVARGLEWYDLGPGAYRYKAELGGVSEDRYRVLASSPTPRGRAAGAEARVRRRLRRLARRLRGRRPR
jgi:CelD/BcsL family acetyltransferase involved in cellulose biosynthesis